MLVPPARRILAADFAPGANDPAGEREQHTGDGPHSPRRSLSGGEGFPLRCPGDDDIPTGDALGRSEGVFAEEFAVHRRDAPISFAGHLFADLPAVAEVAEVAAHANRLIGIAVQTVEHRRGRTRQQTLAHSIDQSFLQCVAAEREEEQRDPWPAISRFFRLQFPLDSRLRIAADHTAGIPRRGRGPDPRPVN